MTRPPYARNRTLWREFPRRDDLAIVVDLWHTPLWRLLRTWWKVRRWPASEVQALEDELRASWSADSGGAPRA